MSSSSSFTNPLQQRRSSMLNLASAIPLHLTKRYGQCFLFYLKSSFPYQDLQISPIFFFLVNFKILNGN